MEWKEYSQEEKESTIKDLALKMLELNRNHDAIRVFKCPKDQWDEIKAGLLSVVLENEAQTEAFKQVVEAIKWEESPTIDIITTQAIVEGGIAEYLGQWAQNVNLMKIASENQVPIAIIQNKDVLLQIWCAWFASKLNTPASSIIIPGR